MANTRERVKDFPTIVGTIQSDDYIPVDGATQGVRKAQVKDIMEAPITGLDTIANTTKGAINELATTAGKVWVGTQDEYDALPDTKLTDNVLHCITDGEPSAYDSIWDKVGTEPLDTTASDCSGAINELNQSLCDFTTFTEIGVLSSGHTTLTINKNTYKALFLYETSGSNTLYTNFVPVASQYALVNNGQTFKIKDSSGETFNFTVAVSGNNVTFTYSSSSNPNAVMRFLGYK